MNLKPTFGGSTVDFFKMENLTLTSIDRMTVVELRQKLEELIIHSNKIVESKTYIWGLNRRFSFEKNSF